MTISAPTVTDQDIFKAVGAWILAVLPGSEIIQLPSNRASMPKHGFIAMSPPRISRLATNINELDDQLRTLQYDAEAVMQVDVYGSNAGRDSSVLAMTFNDELAVNAINASNQSIAPLYVDGASAMPIVSGEEQYEMRYMLELHLQIKPSIEITQQSANVVNAGITNIDTL